jgi:hypothetical protein
VDIRTNIIKITVIQKPKWYHKLFGKKNKLEIYCPKSYYWTTNTLHVESLGRDYAIKESLIEELYIDKQSSPSGDLEYGRGE